MGQEVHDVLGGETRCRGPSGPCRDSKVMLRQGLGSRCKSSLTSIEMGTEVQRGWYPDREGNTESVQEPRRTQLPGGACKDLLDQKVPSLGSRGVNEEGKAVNYWLGKTRGKRSLGGRPMLPRLPSPGGKCYLHTTTHSHGPFSHPGPSSAICVDAVVFLSDPSY